MPPCPYHARLDLAKGREGKGEGGGKQVTIPGLFQNRRVGWEGEGPDQLTYSLLPPP